MFLSQLKELHPLLPPPPLDKDITPAPLTTGVASSVDPAITLNKTVPSGSALSATSLPLDISRWLAPPILPASLDATLPPPMAAPLTLKSEVVPQVYNGGNVTEIPFVDESSKWELLSLLGNWYEPKTFESVFSSIASNAVFFSS